MVRRHVEGPEILLDLNAGGVHGHNETGDAQRVAILAARPREHEVVRRDMKTGVPHLPSVDDPTVDPVALFTPAMGLHPGCVRTVIRLREAERDADRPVERAGNENPLLLFGAEVAEHQYGREIADDRTFILQVVVKTEPFRRQMFADYGHAEVGTVLAAIFLRQRVTQMAGLVRPPAHLAEKLFPVVARQALIVPIRSCMLAPVVA